MSKTLKDFVRPSLHSVTRFDLPHLHSPLFYEPPPTVIFQDITGFLLSTTNHNSHSSINFPNGSLYKAVAGSRECEIVLKAKEVEVHVEVEGDEDNIVMNAEDRVRR